METDLPNDLRQALADHPGQAVSLVDSQTNQTYYLVGEGVLFDAVERDSAARSNLLRSLRDGEQSGEVSRDEARARMRATLDRIADRPTRCD